MPGLEEGDIVREAPIAVSRADLTQRETLRLVEDRLQQILDSDVDRIKKRLEASLDDIINSCSSAAEGNLDGMANTEHQEPPQAGVGSANTEIPGSILTEVTEPFITSFQNPFELLAPGIDAGWTPCGLRGAPPSLNSAINQGLTPDSGYQSGRDPCLCSCHSAGDTRRFPSHKRE